MLRRPRLSVLAAKHNAFGIAAVAVIVWGCASEPAPTAAQVDELEEEAWFPEPEPEPEDEDEEVPTAEPSEPETAPSVVAAIAAIAPQPEAEPPTVAPQTDEPKTAPRAEKAKPAADRVPSKDEPASKVIEDIDPEPPASDPIVDDPVPLPPTAVPSAAPKPSPPVEPLNGEFRYGGGEAQKNRAAEAVEAVVDQMSLVSRGIARRRLLESTAPVRAVELRIDGSDVTAVFDGRRYQAKLGGAAVKVTGASGDPLEFKVRRRKDQLMLAFTGDRGGKTYVMRVDDKDRLRMRVTIHSSSLPDSVVYQLTYRRA